MSPPPVINSWTKIRIYPLQLIPVTDLKGGFAWASGTPRRLDAIQQRDRNLSAIEAIREAFPWIELWVDSGIADSEAFRESQTQKLGRAVIETECSPHPALIAMLRAEGGGPCPPCSRSISDGVGHSVRKVSLPTRRSGPTTTPRGPRAIRR